MEFLSLWWVLKHEPLVSWGLPQLQLQSRCSNLSKSRGWGNVKQRWVILNSSSNTYQSNIICLLLPGIFAWSFCLVGYCLVLSSKPKYRCWGGCITKLFFNVVIVTNSHSKRVSLTYCVHLAKLFPAPVEGYGGWKKKLLCLADGVAICTLLCGNIFLVLESV